VVAGPAAAVAAQVEVEEAWAAVVLPAAVADALVADPLEAVVAEREEAVARAVAKAVVVDAPAEVDRVVAEEDVLAEVVVVRAAVVAAVARVVADRAAAVRVAAEVAGPVVGAVAKVAEDKGEAVVAVVPAVVGAAGIVDLSASAGRRKAAAPLFATGTWH